MKTQREALQWVGLMGHAFAVLRSDGDNWDSYAECNTLASAKQAAKDLTCTTAIFQQVKPRTWKEVKK